MPVLLISISRASIFLSSGNIIEATNNSVYTRLGRKVIHRMYGLDKFDKKSSKTTRNCHSYE